MAKTIMGIQLEERSDTATKVQKLLTEYGCFIKTRLGLHKASEERDVCSEKGLILIEFIIDAEKQANELEEKLNTIEGTVVKKMKF